MSDPLRLLIGTCTTNRVRAQDCLQSWADTAEGKPQLAVLENGGSEPYLGTVPAFRQLVDDCLALPDWDVLALLHDDLQILEQGWDAKVLRYFERQPGLGLAGFGGAVGLGDADLYQKPYAPTQLARIGFRSDLVDAERHGIRSRLAEPVACLDGFSQIGRRAFWEGWGFNRFQSEGQAGPEYRPWTILEQLGIVHHLYDGLLGAIARRHGWQVWYLPVRCQHFGGRTAVGDPGYQQWAQTQVTGGDHGFWESAHAIGYEAFRDVLPLRP